MWLIVQICWIRKVHCLFVNVQIIHYLCAQARCKHKEHAIMQCDKYRAHLHVSKALLWKKHRRQKRQPQTDYDYDAAMSNRLWSMLYLGFTSFLHHKISTRIWCLCHLHWYRYRHAKASTIYNMQIPDFRTNFRKVRSKHEIKCILCAFLQCFSSINNDQLRNAHLFIHRDYLSKGKCSRNVHGWFLLCKFATFFFINHIDSMMQASDPAWRTTWERKNIFFLLLRTKNRPKQ